MKQLSFLIPFLLFSQLTFSQIKFENGSLSELIQKAKSENKVLMVDVLTDWCKWCIELDNKVYADAEVSAFANANQLNFKIDAEKGEGIDFAKKYKIIGYPTVLFLDGDGNEIDRVYGYYPKKEFFAMMQDYNKGVNTFNALQQTLEKDPANIEANLHMADKYIALGETDKAKAHLNKIIETDPQNAGGKTDDAKFKLASLAEKESVIKDLENFIKDNPESDVLKDACQTLAEYYYSVNADVPNADMCYKELLSKYPDDDNLRSSYGQYLNQRAVTLADKGTGAADYKEGLKLVDQALPYVKGSVNEASSYYIQSKLLYNLKEYTPALESVDKALTIFNRKLYRDHKEKIESELQYNQTDNNENFNGVVRVGCLCSGKDFEVKDHIDCNPVCYAFYLSLVRVPTIIRQEIVQINGGVSNAFQSLLIPVTDNFQDFHRDMNLPGGYFYRITFYDEDDQRNEYIIGNSKIFFVD